MLAQYMPLSYDSKYAIGLYNYKVQYTNHTSSVLGNLLLHSHTHTTTVRRLNYKNTDTYEELVHFLS